MKPAGDKIPVIGVDREELRWLRILVWLLRHPDPSVPELARQALLYLSGAAHERCEKHNEKASPQKKPVTISTTQGQFWYPRPHVVAVWALSQEAPPITSPSRIRPRLLSTRSSCAAFAARAHSHG